MSEEFKPIRITLSEEAFDRMEKIMKKGKLRSYSSTIEECIRVVHELMGDVSHTIGVPGKTKTFTQEQAFQAFMIIATRLSRLTGVGVILKSNGE